MYHTCTCYCYSCSQYCVHIHTSSTIRAGIYRTVYVPYISRATATPGCRWCGATERPAEWLVGGWRRRGGHSPALTDPAPAVTWLARRAGVLEAGCHAARARGTGAWGGSVRRWDVYCAGRRYGDATAANGSRNGAQRAEFSTPPGAAPELTKRLRPTTVPNPAGDACVPTAKCGYGNAASRTVSTRTRPCETKCVSPKCVVPRQLRCCLCLLWSASRLGPCHIGRLKSMSVPW